MTRSRALTTIAVVVAPSLAFHSGYQHSANLVGKWENSVEQGDTKTQTTIEFFSNGTYSRRVAIVSEFGWTQSGDILYLAQAVHDKDSVFYQKPAAVQLKFAGDVLEISDPQKKISMKRVTVPINESALLGRWEGVSELNEGFVQDFLSDGRLIVTVILARSAGHYSVADDKIQWEQQIPTPQKKKTKYRMDAEKLVLYTTPDLPGLELTRTGSLTAAR